MAWASAAVLCSRKLEPVRQRFSLSTSPRRRIAEVITSSNRVLSGSLARVEGAVASIPSTSASSEHAPSRLPLLARSAARLRASHTSTRFRSRSRVNGGAGARLTASATAPAAGRATPAQTSQLLVSILMASTYCSEKRTTSIIGSSASRAGNQMSTGTWHSSPACRSPIDTS